MRLDIPREAAPRFRAHCCGISIVILIVIAEELLAHRARWLRAALRREYNKMGIGWPIYHPRNEE